MSKVIRMSLFFLALLGMPGAPASLRAQEGDPAERFLIEKITVEGVQRRSARAIVAAETRLREGETYTEAALRQAIYRVKRLPFVLDAEMSLRRGSTRGAYELVVTVEPTRPVFFLAQTNGSILSEDDAPFLADRDRFFYSSSATAGVRQFLGARGLVFASVDKSEGFAPSYRAGYTLYNLAGSGGYASVGSSWTRDDDFNDFESLTGNAELGFPLSANQSLRSSVFWARGDGRIEQNVGEALEITSRSESWGVDLDWRYDTTDDPVFPSQGDKVTGGVAYSEGRTRITTSIGDLEAAFVETSTDSTFALGLSGIRHIRLTPRQSVALGADGFRREYDAEPRSPFASTGFWRAGVEGRHSLSLWGFEKTERLGDLRLESALFLSHSRASVPAAEDPSATSAGLTTAVVFRNAWGILRASLTYSEDDL
jgi:outer membrane protein assembly factor BamA